MNELFTSVFQDIFEFFDSPGIYAAIIAFFTVLTCRFIRIISENPEDSVIVCFFSWLWKKVLQPCFQYLNKTVFTPCFRYLKRKFIEYLES